MSTYVIRMLAATRRFAAAAVRAARRACAAFAQFNREQTLYTQRRFARDLYLSAPGKAADTYAEFLFRTRGPLRHEPSARARLDGHPVH